MSAHVGTVSDGGEGARGLAEDNRSLAIFSMSSKQDELFGGGFASGFEFLPASRLGRLVSGEKIRRQIRKTLSQFTHDKPL